MQLHWECVDCCISTEIKVSILDVFLLEASLLGKRVCGFIQLSCGALFLTEVSITGVKFQSGL